LGLVDKKKIQKAKSQQRKLIRGQHKKQHNVADVPTLGIEKIRLAKLEKDRRLNKERQQLAEKTALAAQVKQLIEQSAIVIDKGEIQYNFCDRFDNKIKNLYVTAAIRKDLSSDRLAIAMLDQGYYVVTRQVADKIAQRSESTIVFMASNDTDTPAADDPYKDYIIPDDLQW